MLFTQGAHITKGVIQWGPAKKKNVKFVCLYFRLFLWLTAPLSRKEK